MFTRTFHITDEICEYNEYIIVYCIYKKERKKRNKPVCVCFRDIFSNRIDYVLMSDEIKTVLVAARGLFVHNEDDNNETLY